MDAPPIGNASGRQETTGQVPLVVAVGAAFALLLICISFHPLPISPG